MPTLKASRLGIAKIKPARNEQGWGWSIDDNNSCLLEASKVLEPDQNWRLIGDYANSISERTGKQDLAERQPISAVTFNAYCEILGLNWEELVERCSSAFTDTHQDWGEAIDLSIFYGRTAPKLRVDMRFSEPSLTVLPSAKTREITTTAR